MNFYGANDEIPFALGRLKTVGKIVKTKIYDPAIEHSNDRAEDELKFAIEKEIKLLVPSRSDQVIVKLDINHGHCGQNKRSVCIEAEFFVVEHEHKLQFQDEF